MSDSLWPCGLQPTRILCAWHFPGKNTRTGCHFLLLKIFLTQALNQCPLHLLHQQADGEGIYTTLKWDSAICFSLSIIFSRNTHPFSCCCLLQTDWKTGMFSKLSSIGCAFFKRCQRIRWVTGKNESWMWHRLRL